MERAFLDRTVPLVLAVADWLAERLRRTPGGVKSLSHLLVIVPTRQAGRRLRLALAEHTGGCLPPLVRLPAQVITPAHEPDLPVATAPETLGLLGRLLSDLDLSAYPCLFPETGRPRERTFPWALGVARQLNDLWGILQENALTMADVAAQAETLLAGEDLDVEVARWRDLARLEARFFKTLRALGRTPAPLARQQAVADPLLPEGVEGIVLPALADAQPALYPALERLADRAGLSVLLHADPADDGRFDRWGRPDPAQWLGDCAPLLPLDDSQITLAANSVEQARLAATRFAAIPPDEVPPALGLADDSLFDELQSAFLARGLALHNPAAYPLAASSLGRLIGQLEQLCRQPHFTTLAAFLREADVQRWLEARLAPEASGLTYAALLRALDDLQNAHLPQTLAAARAFCAQALGAAQQAGANAPPPSAASATPRARTPAMKQAGASVQTGTRVSPLPTGPTTLSARSTCPSPLTATWDALLRALDAISDLLDPHGRPHLDHLTSMLQAIFATRPLRERTPGDRELAAAAEATIAVFDALDSDVLAGALDDAQRSLLFETLLASATYQLEPENADALLTEGWLELPWSPAPDLVITGFNEGSVPDAVVGHAFLPDRLRQGLGLTSNERRTARDTYLLQALLASRPAGAVRLLLERVSGRHDVRKPSRLLFLCDEPTLTSRAKRLFSDAESAAAGHPPSLPDDWRLALPIPGVAPERLSVTAFKSYLACPFTFYLRHILAMEPDDDRAAELDPLAFGTLCHNALEAFGRSALKDSSAAEVISRFLQNEVWRAMRHDYGEALPAILHLQASAACKRLDFFALRQAQLRAEGWQIVETERSLQMTERGLTVRGRADRIDRHEGTGAWRILDYKTWDRLGKNDGVDRFASASKAALATAAARGFPTFTFADKPRVWTDLQLPLYLLMAQAGAFVPAGEPVACGYFVLGETEEETVCRTWDFSGCRDEAAEAVRVVIDRVRAGLFWPPSPKDEWARDYATLFLESPEASVSRDWIADQARRLDSVSPSRKDRALAGERPREPIPSQHDAHQAGGGSTASRPPKTRTMAGERPREPRGGLS
jgi:ATP-dependent helicase/nuclease subunit B